MNTLPKMRTAKGALAELRKLDPETEITENMIRNIIKSGEIPVVEVGRKKLINMDVLISHIYSTATV